MKFTVAIRGERRGFLGVNHPPENQEKKYHLDVIVYDIYEYF